MKNAAFQNQQTLIIINQAVSEKLWNYEIKISINKISQIIKNPFITTKIIYINLSYKMLVQLKTIRQSEN